jgi:hypothetical protein
MNATRILVAQHRAIAALFDDVAHERGRARARAVSRLAEELIAHMSAEQSVFYPPVLRAIARRPGQPVATGDVHLPMRVQLRRVLECKIGHPSLDENVSALRALFDQHVADEEGGLFPAAEVALDAGDLELLGGEVLASRPPVWIVTTEGRQLVQSTDGWSLRGVSLPTGS